MRTKLSPITWLRQQIRNQRKARKYFRQLNTFRKLLIQSDPTRFSASIPELRQCLDDDQPNTGFDRHYVYHTAWAARILADARPLAHIDISSMLYFSTLISAFIPVQFYDYRPANVQLNGLTCHHADLQKLPFADNSVPSLSCMHVVEHIGLGRYGEPLDPQGDLQAMAELKRVLASGGDLLFVAPVGRPRIVFNAHRIYAYQHILEAFQGLTLHEFALIPDKINGNGLMLNATEAEADAQEYGCGCFWFKKV